MTLIAGTRLGPYEIGSPIGKGGMGEVYRARDTKLERDVAIKVLPDELASDEERVARFEREAKLLASLNHPNIASIHGFEESDGVKALVLELVEGPTLAERIAQGPIPVDEAIAIAKQIAEALEAGHEAGIIHRDLKPANIKLREDGTVKVLDYGLAKALEGETASGGDSELSQSPTLTRQGTQVGLILGTAAYMSPEQAKGKRVDKRTDIFAFGAVLYEMLTGKRVFGGEDLSETLAAVIRAEPDWDALPAELSPALLTYLTRCLEKDSKRRVRDIGDVKLAMEGAFETGAGAPVTVPPRARPASFRGLLVGLVLGGVLAGVAFWAFQQPSSAPVNRFAVQLAAPLLGVSGPPLLAISPDGRTIVYAGIDQIYVRELSALESRPVPNTDQATTPFFSADGQWIGFQTSDRRSLRKVALGGGPAITLAETSVAGASWGEDDTILYGANDSELMRVSAEGGTPRPVSSRREGEGDHWRPDFLPGGKAALFTIWSGGLETAQIAVVSLDTREHRTLTGGTYPRYTPSGHIVFAREGSIWAAPFDVGRLELTGTPVPVVDDVWVTPNSGAAQFAVSDNGTLVYVERAASLQLGASGASLRHLTWVDRDGREVPVDGSNLRQYAYARVSPDGTRIALDLRDEENDIWIWDITRETMTRFTFGPAPFFRPVWTPDGTRIAFGSGTGKEQIFWKSADGTGAVERLYDGAANRVPYSFLPDGRRLLFGERIGNIRHDIGVLEIGGSSELLLSSGANEENAEISPDGRLIAYQSDESGRDHIYVRRFPNVDDGRWQISSGDGGVQPLWSPGGDELFYLRARARSSFFDLVAVSVESESGFSPGNDSMILEGIYVDQRGRTGRVYDLTPDGERFLFIKSPVAEGEDLTELVLVQNWTEELKRLVPTND